MARRGSISSVRIEIAISCQSLIQRDRFARSVEPLCILYVKSRGSRQWKEVGRTERLHNTLNPEWSQTMVLDYYFEEKQRPLMDSSALLNIITDIIERKPAIY